MSTLGPLREYYLRVTKNGVLEGPYTFYEANYIARTATREAARTGIGPVTRELVVNIGTRQGDPPQPTDPTIRVVAVFVAGRKTIGGSLAQYNSDKNNT